MIRPTFFLVLTALLLAFDPACNLFAQAEAAKTGAAQAEKSETKPAEKPVEKTSGTAAPNSGSTTSTSQPAAGGDVSMERQPYRIDLRFSVAENVAIDSATANRALGDLKALSDRVIGQPWRLQARWVEGEIWDTDFELWQQWPEPIQYDRKTTFPSDKIWLVRARAAGDSGSLELVGREFDFRSGILGPMRRRVTTLADLPRGLLLIGRDLFRPMAEVVGNEGGGVRLRVQGSGLTAASPDGAVVREGQYFQLVRLFYERSGKFVASSIEPWTYLKAGKPDTTGVVAQIISSFRDPVGRKYRQTNKLMALAFNPSDTATQLSFNQLVNTNGTPVRHPVAGYKVEIHRWPDGEVMSTHVTDRDGRLKVDPPVGLDFFGVRLVGGAIEPLLDVPVLAGDAVPAILADTKPAAVEFEQKLIAFRDELLDVIARRLVIEARLADRTKSADWDRVAELLRAWKATPIASTFVNQLADWKVTAQKRQITEKKAIFTQSAQALMAELETLVSRYESQEVDDYEEALQKRKSPTPKKSQNPAGGDSAKKAASNPASQPPGNTTNSTSASTPPEGSRYESIDTFIAAPPVPEGFTLSKQDLVKDGVKLGRAIAVSRGDDISKIAIFLTEKDLSSPDARRDFMKGTLMGLELGFQNKGFQFVEKRFPDSSRDGSQPEFKFECVFLNGEKVKVGLKGRAISTRQYGASVQAVSEDESTLELLNRWVQAIQFK